MEKLIDKLHITYWYRKPYLTRDIVYEDDYGVLHNYRIADEQLADIIFTKVNGEEDWFADVVDEEFFCYAPLDILVIEDDMQIALWLQEHGRKMGLDKKERK